MDIKYLNYIVKYSKTLVVDKELIEDGYDEKIVYTVFDKNNCIGEFHF